MSDSLGKIVERIILVFVCILAPTIFFQIYGSISRETFVEDATRSYLETTSANGSTDTTQFVLYREALAVIGGYETELSYTTFHDQPVYGFYPAAEIVSYFSDRNRWDGLYYKTEPETVSDADIETLRMQKKTNATELARLMENGAVIGADIPASETAIYTAIIPDQEIYAGEHLVTIVQIDTGSMVYYAVGDDIAPGTSGTYTICLSGVSTSATVNVTAWARKVTCPFCNNEYTCTEKVLNDYKANLRWDFCPYCEATVGSIVADTPLVNVSLGTEEGDITDVTFTVTYLDGHTESLALIDLSNNYASGFCGEQNISVSYKGYHADHVCKIVTQGPKCSKCGAHITNRNEFDCSIYPLCPDCMSMVPSFLGACVVSPETFTSKQIENELLLKGFFPMGRDDYFSVAVSHRGGRINGKYSFMSADKDAYFRMGTKVRRTGLK